MLVAKDTQIANLNEALARAESRAGIRARERELEAELLEVKDSMEALGAELQQARDTCQAREKELEHLREAAAATESALRQELAGFKDGTPSKHVLKAGMEAAEENVHELRSMYEDV